MEKFLFSDVGHFRYERKFYIQELDRAQVESIIMAHPSLFREIYHQRFVNNIYFDSINMQHYFDNIDGLARRFKVRVRWYGKPTGLLENPMLELKFKHNLHVGKLLYPLEAFVLDEKSSMPAIQGIFERAPSLPDGLRLYLKELNFSLFNRYSRKYFLSADRRYRITVDSGLQAYELKGFGNNFLRATEPSDTIIVELKYNKDQDKEVDFITNYFPFRLTRSSKYTAGIEALTE